jgi:hypothetical protein
LLALPLSIGSMNNGQANIVFTALFLLSLIAVKEDRWAMAAVYLVAACSLKVYALALCLPLLLYRPVPLSWRLVLAAAVAAGLCFLTQRPSYVAGQFADWIHDLRTDFSLLSTNYRDFRLLLRAVRLDVSDRTYECIQLLGAAAVGGICFGARKLDRATVLRAMYSLVVCWILLLGPATESSTYVLLAPALASELIETWSVPGPRAYKGALIAVCCLLAIGAMAVWFPFSAKIHALGEQPLAVLVFLAYTLWKLFTAMRGGDDRAEKAGASAVEV